MPRSRFDDEDDRDDDRPRSRRPRDEAEDDETPRRKRRRDDEEEEPKKGSALFVILGIVGGLLLLCGAGVYFGLIEPAARKQREENDRLQAELDKAIKDASSPAPNPTPDKPAPPGDSVATLTTDQLADGVSQYTGKAVTVSGVAGFVSTKPDGSGVVRYQTGGGRKQVRATFPAANWTKDKIKPGDAVGAKGVVGEAGGAVELGGCEVVMHQANSLPPPGPSTLTAQGLAEKFRAHSGKAVTVEGVVETAVKVPTGTNVVLGTTPGFSKVRLLFPKGKWTADKPAAAGDTVAAKGTVTKAVTARTFVDVNDCELVKHTPGKPDEGIAVTAVDVTAEYDKDAKVADAKYRGKTLKVTGEVLRADDAGGTAGAVVFLKGATPTDKKKDSVRVSAVVTGDGKADALKLKAGDKVTFTGRVGTFRVELTTNDWTLVLGQAKLVK